MADAGAANRASPEHEHSEILEQVLRETLSLAEQDRSLDEAECEALCDVARRHGGLLETQVAEELVAAVLSTRLGRVVAPSLREPMSRTIAETLLDDPPARKRLESLWRRLREAVG